MNFNNPYWNGVFRCEKDDPDEFCEDAEKDETLCETCKFYEEPNGIPTCCGHEYKEREE